MFGAVLKSYYAEKNNIDPAKIVTVSIMPCTAKKYEAARPELSDKGYQDVDYVLTTRELARMIKEAASNSITATVSLRIRSVRRPAQASSSVLPAV